VPSNQIAEGFKFCSLIGWLTRLTLYTVYWTSNLQSKVHKGSIILTFHKLRQLVKSLAGQTYCDSLYFEKQYGCAKPGTHNLKDHSTTITLRCQIATSKTPYTDFNCQHLPSDLPAYMAADDVI